MEITLKRTKISPQIVWECVLNHGVSSPAVEIATHFWIAYFVLWQMCVFVFSRLLPFLHCSLYLLPSIFASFSQVRFFFGTKAFLWPIVCVLVEFVAFANLFVYSHMVRTQTNAHCYRNAGHHSYRMKEWELQLKVHNGIHNMRKKTEQPTTTTLTTSAGRAKKKVAAKNRNKLPYAVAVVLKSRHEHRMNSDTLLF